MASATPYRMISARVSPMVELARWLFERQGLPYREEAHAPMLHVLATLAVKGGVEVPAVVTPNGTVWKGARDTLNGVDAASAPGQRLFGLCPDSPRTTPYFGAICRRSGIARVSLSDRWYTAPRFRHHSRQSRTWR